MTSTINSSEIVERLRTAAEKLDPLAQPNKIAWFAEVPAHVNLDALGIDVDAAERRFELAARGRELLPAIAAWKRDVLAVAFDDDQLAEVGDDIANLVFALSGVSALDAVTLEIGWVGGDPDSEKTGKLTSEALDFYAEELVDETKVKSAPNSRDVILDELEQIESLARGLRRVVHDAGPGPVDADEMTAWLDAAIAFDFPERRDDE